MLRKPAIVWTLSTIVLVQATIGREPQPDPGAQLDFGTDILPLLATYCADCHSGQSPAAGIDFETLDVRIAATKDRNLWKKVHLQLVSRIMPPPDTDQPSESERQQLIDWIDHHALTVPCSGPSFPGRVTLRRLNRDEYNRTIRDLIGIDYRPADDFPSDDVGYGFDNIGDVLTLPPVLLERYLDAAESILRRAIVVAEEDFAPVTELPGRMLASVDEVSHEIEIPVMAEYLVRVKAYGDQAGPEPAKMELFVADKKVKTFDVTSTSKDPGIYEMKTRIPAGNRRFAARFINDYYAPDHPDPSQRGDRNLNILSIEIVGPIGNLPKELPASHQQLIPHSPRRGSDRETALNAVRENLKRFVPRALRRPTNAAELKRYTDIANMVLDDGSSFERAMQVAMQAVLVSPHFLFRVERDPPSEGPVTERELNDFELASRISYFLWSSKPDDALYLAAANKRLKNPDELQGQIHRMLNDPRSNGLVQNFTGQWLQLRNLDTISMDRDRFPEFTPEMRQAMRRETELLFATVLRENRSVMELLTSDFTFVNPLLAALYGIEGVTEDEFTRVSLDGLPRSGLLGQASILAVTSNPTRTSPVKRGKWILDNLFATPPPPAPPNVPALEEADGDRTVAVSLRQQLELHRSKPECSACHQLMDPLGFGLENFNAIGKWRDEDAGQPIEPLGELPDGRVFNGFAGLQEVLLERQAEFRRCLAGKLLTYALGRGLEYFDECTLDEITANMQQRGDTLTVLIEEIINSRPFQWRARTALP
jgi:hypothetical protein